MSSKRILFSMLEIVPDNATEQQGQISETNARAILKFHGRFAQALTADACKTCGSTYAGNFGSGESPCADPWHKNAGI
jgi:hypothetical protein